MMRQAKETLPIQRKFDEDEFQRLIKNDLVSLADDDSYYITDKGLKRIDKV